MELLVLLCQWERIYPLLLDIFILGKKNHFLLLTLKTYLFGAKKTVIWRKEFIVVLWLELKMKILS